MDFANILPELFVEVVDPELQSSKRVADHEKLCKFTV